MNTLTQRELDAMCDRATAEKWERERANIGSYERWLAQRAIDRADKVAAIARMKRAIGG